LNPRPSGLQHSALTTTLPILAVEGWNLLFAMLILAIVKTL
jgi:hypothetical protein